MTTRNDMRNNAIPATTNNPKHSHEHKHNTLAHTSTTKGQSGKVTSFPRNKPTTTNTKTKTATTHKTFNSKRVTPDVSKPDTYEFFPLEQPNFPEWDFDLADLDSNYLILDQATPKGKDPFKDKETPTIFFAASVYKEMMYIAQKAAKKGTEIGGLMLIKQVQDMYPQFVAYDHFMVGQEVTSVRVEMDNDDLVKHIEHLREKFPEQLGTNTHRKLMHWHLHPNMGVTFSTTDTEQQEGRDKLGFRDDYRFYVCVNERGDINIEMIQYYPVFHRFKDVNVGIYYAKNYLNELDKPRKKELDLWMEKLVTRKVQSYGVGSYYGGYGYGNQGYGTGPYGLGKQSTWDEKHSKTSKYTGEEDTFTPEELEDFRRAMCSDESDEDFAGENINFEKYELIHDAFWGLDKEHGTHGISLTLKEMLLSHTIDITEPLIGSVTDAEVKAVVGDSQFWEEIYNLFEDNHEDAPVVNGVKKHAMLDQAVLLLAKAHVKMATENNEVFSPITTKATITTFMENINLITSELQKGWDIEEATGIMCTDYAFHNFQAINSVKRAFESYALKDLDFYSQLTNDISPADFITTMVTTQ
jgi:hypothetical protein